MERKALTGYKITLHVLTLILLVWKLSVREWGHAGLCVLCLALYSLPFLLGLLLHASIPPLLEAAALTFAAAANLGGEVLGMYLRTPVWDSGLHFVWGILAAVIGYAMPDLLTGVECWITAGGAHHTVLSYDVTAEQMHDWATMMDIEFVHISKDTTPEKLEEELFLKDLAWKLK